MHEFRTKMAENGRIIIPMACRRLLNIKPGEDLVLVVENEELRLFTVKHALNTAKNKIRQYAKNKSLVKKLKAMRKSDENHE